MRIASLPMYDLPELEEATTAWWRGLAQAFAAEGIDDVPARLTQSESLSHWRDPNLLFSQTCGFPYTRELHQSVRLVATPSYVAAGCNGPNYCSLLLAGDDAPALNAGDLRTASVAVNSFGSQSGWVALCAALVDADQAPAFSGTRVTGSHAASIATVIRGEAQLCAVDCITYALLKEHVPDSIAGSRIVQRSPASPGLPYITSRTTSDDDLVRLRAGLRRALESASLASVRDALLISGCEVLDDSAYDRIREMAQGPGIARRT